MPPKSYPTVKKKKNVDPYRLTKLARNRRMRKIATQIRLPPGFLPSEKILTMKIAFAVSATSVADGAVAFQNINISSVYDPMGSSGSRQYYGAQIMFQMYKYATILSVRYKLIAMAPYSDTNPFLIIGRIQPTSAADTAIDQPADFYESPYRSTPGVKMFGNYITKNLNDNNHIKGSYSAKRFFGANSNIGSDPDFSSTLSSNPTNAAYLGLYWAVPPGTTTASTTMSFMFTATAIVKWWGALAVDND